MAKLEHVQNPVLRRLETEISFGRKLPLPSEIMVLLFQLRDLPYDPEMEENLIYLVKWCRAEEQNPGR